MRQFKVNSECAMVHTQSALLEGWEKCSDLKTLMSFADSKTELPAENMNWTGTKMPAALMQQMLGTIRQFPKMEVAFSLYYSLAEKKWAVKCPQQNGHGAAVHFEDDGLDMPAGYAIIGSVHTHPEMGAFWSATDLADQKKKHGVHLVLGLRNGYATQYKLSIFTPYGAYDKDWNDIIEAVDFNQDWEPVAEWVEEIKAQRLPVQTQTTKPAPITVTSGSGNAYSNKWQRRWDNAYAGGYAGRAYQTTLDDYYDYDYDNGYASDWRGYQTLKPEDARRRDSRFSALVRLLDKLRFEGEYAMIAKAFADVFRTAPTQWYTNEAEDLVDDNDLEAASFLADELLDRLTDILESLEALGQIDDTLYQQALDILKRKGWIAYEPVQDAARPIRQEAVTC